MLYKFRTFTLALITLAFASTPALAAKVAKKEVKQTAEKAQPVKKESPKACDFRISLS